MGRVVAPEGDGDTLTLSTIHSAKGLEWKVVFLLWVLDGKLPLARVAEDEDETVITSYSIHYTKVYETSRRGS